MAPETPDGTPTAFWRRVTRSPLRTIGTAATALMLGALVVFGASMNRGGGYLADPLPWLALWSFGTALAFAALLIGAERLVDASLKRHAPQGTLARFVPTLTWRSVLGFAAITMALWAPWLIALYPGSMSWDTFYQIEQCYPDGHPTYLIPYWPTGSFVENAFSDHHPIFDTLVFGAFARASDVLFGTWNYGVFAFVLVQAFGTATAFVATIAYLRERGCPAGLCLGCLAFFALMPFFPCYAATMVKDSLFSWLYVPWFLVVVEVARTKGACLKSRSTLAWLLALGLLLCLTKKTGLYVVLFSLVVLAVANRQAWKPLLACALSSALLMWVALPLVVFPLLDVVPGGKQEMLGPLFQQTARYAAEHPDDVTAEEREAIDRVLGYDTLVERYNPLNADPVKFMYRYEGTTSDLLHYLATWAVQGLRHPDSYVKATFATVAPYVAPGPALHIHRSTGDVEHDGSPLVWRPASLEGYHAAMMGLYDFLAGLPVVGLLFQTFLYSFVVPVFGLYLATRRCSAMLAAYGAVIISFIACVITPVFHSRYALPLIYTAPLLAAMAFSPSLAERQPESRIDR